MAEAVCQCLAEKKIDKEIYKNMSIERNRAAAIAAAAGRKAVCLLTLLAVGLAAGAHAELRIITTFYPVYVLTASVTQGVPEVRVHNMAEQSVGCLHDYTLQPQDIASLEQADVLVINGGGMEQFMDRVVNLRAELPVIDTCAGLKLADSWEEGLKNAHVWLSPALASVQIGHIAEGLSDVDPEHAEAYRANAARLGETLAALEDELRGTLASVSGERIITFHEAFQYFADDMGIEVAGVIAHEPGEAPGTREIAETCDLVRSLGIRALFTEPQYPQQAAEVIARETGASVWQLDPFVSGDGTFEGYLSIMRENAAVMLEALTQ